MQLQKLLKTPKLASQEVQKTRKDKCYNCDFLFKPMNICKECKCNINIKTKFLYSQCPLGYWN